MKWIVPVLLAMSSTPAMAAGKFGAPKGCTVFLTVQLSSCQVANHYTCKGEPAGNQWVAYSDPDGPVYLSQIDRETRWLQDIDLRSNEVTAIADEKDPASFDELLKTGLDSYDFTTLSQSGEEKHYQGYDKLTGKTITIDGVKLEQTEFDLTTRTGDGTFVSHRTGNQLISRDWRIFFADTEDYETDKGEKGSSKTAPVTFSKPGSEGFESDTPDFGCDMQMTEAPPLLQSVALKAAP